MKRMKILWLGREEEGRWGSLKYNPLIDALCMRADVKVLSAIRKSEINPSEYVRQHFYITPSKIYCAGSHNVNWKYRVAEEIDMVEFDYDVVIIGYFTIDIEANSWLNLRNLDIPKVMMCSDPHNNFPSHIFYAEQFDVDSMLLAYKPWIKQYARKTICNIGWLPWSFNDIYDPKTPKTVNAVFAPADTPLYPLRTLMYVRWMKEKFQAHPIGGFSEYTRSWDKYMRFLNKTRLFLFDNSFYNYSLKKWFEAFSMNMAVLSPQLDEQEDLHFIPDVNYVPVTKDNWYEKFKYYMEHKEEAEEIGKKARETYLKYHTSDIRALQLIEKLKELL